MRKTIKLTHEMLVTGFKKGNYVVLEQVRATKDEKKVIYYRCRCDCGSEKLLTKGSLQSTEGCRKCRWGRFPRISHPSAYPLGYKKYGYTILDRVIKKGPGLKSKKYYKCKCDCGIVKLILRTNFGVARGCKHCRTKRYGLFGKKLKGASK